MIGLPHQLAAAGLVDLRQHVGVGGQLLRVGGQHGQVEHAQVDAFALGALLADVAQVDQQCLLPAREVDVDIGQQLRIQQRAVQRAAGVVDTQAIAQRVQAVALDTSVPTLISFSVPGIP